MRKGLDQFEDLRDDGIRYVELKWASIRLAVVEKMSVMLSKVVGYIIFAALLLMGLALLMVALALWVGEMLGSLSLGFLISGGVFVLAAVIIFMCRNVLVANSMVRFFIGLFFTDNDDEDGTQK